MIIVVCCLFCRFGYISPPRSSLSPTLTLSLPLSAQQRLLLFIGYALWFKLCWRVTIWLLYASTHFICFLYFFVLKNWEKNILFIFACNCNYALISCFRFHHLNANALFFVVVSHILMDALSVGKRHFSWHLSLKIIIKKGICKLACLNKLTAIKFMFKSCEIRKNFVSCCFFLTNLSLLICRVKVSIFSNQTMP